MLEARVHDWRPFAATLLVSAMLATACWHEPQKLTVRETASSIESAPPPPADAVFSADHVMERIMTTYRRQIRRCYQTVLTKVGETEGKIVLSFAIDHTGHLVNGRAEGMGREITSCAERSMSAWHFARPADGDATQFQVPIRLVPN